jgi:magnesium transporter
MSKRKRRFQRNTKPGAPPGTVVAQNGSETKIRVLGYTASSVKELDVESFAAAKEYADEFDVVWIDVIGLGEVERLREFGQLFTIHSLTLEDVVNVHQRAKSETFDNYHYIVTRMVSAPPQFETEQLSIFQTEKFVITFQERAGDCLEPLRERIRTAKGVVRSKTGDFLVYAILDTVFDHSFL